jgi:NDP-sugar pyrophosphorylase family protein
VTAWPPAALVLTAGIGTRLHPLTLVRAKPAVPIAGVPVISRILRALAAAGVHEAVLNLHHRPESITAIVGDGSEYGVRVRYSWEDPVLGSGGGPRRALPLLAGDQFLLVNGDTLPTVDVCALWTEHEAHGALVTMTLIRNPAPERYGGVLVDDDGWVTGFCRRGDPRPSYHFFFAQAVKASVFADLSPDAYSESVGELYPVLIAANPRAVRAYVCDAPFIEVGTPADCLRAERDIAGLDGVAAWRPGRGSTVAAGARVVESVLWDRVRIDKGAVVEGSILADDVHVQAGMVLRHCSAVPAAGHTPRGQERIERGLLIAPLA